MENLSGFDPSTMTYYATQMGHPNMSSGSDPFQEMLLPMDVPDHHSAYGYAGYDRQICARNHLANSSIQKR